MLFLRFVHKAIFLHDRDDAMGAMSCSIDHINAT